VGGGGVHAIYCNGGFKMHDIYCNGNFKSAVLVEASHLRAAVIKAEVAFMYTQPSITACGASTLVYHCRIIEKSACNRCDDHLRS
jgi:hypothetical protein